MPEVFFPYQNSKFKIGANWPLIREGGKQSGARETIIPVINGLLGKQLMDH